MPAHRRRRGRNADRDGSVEPAEAGTPENGQPGGAGAERAAGDDQTLADVDQTLADVDRWMLGVGCERLDQLRARAAAAR
jgi:hypothetical protein